MDIPLYFYIAYKDLDRLSPGSVDTTLNVLEKIDRENILNILDVGCGVGQSTILLANYFENATVEAIDLFQHYLDVLDEKIANNNLEDRVFSYQMSMMDLDFANEEFDIVFAESSIEIIGFNKGLKEWKRLLKPNGYLIVSDVSWISKPSQESKRFWKDTYDEVDTIEAKISQIEDEGYEFIDHIIVPKDDWIDYNNNLESNLQELKSDASAKEFTKKLKRKIDVYRRNGNDYSYVFYIAQK